MAGVMFLPSSQASRSIWMTVVPARSGVVSGSGKISRKKRRPGDEQHVAALDSGAQGPRGDEVDASHVERMPGGEVVLGGVALEHRRAQRFRHRGGLRLGVGHRDVVADHQHRALGGEQEAGGLLHGGGIDAPTPAGVRRGHDLDLGLLVERVERQRQEDRTARRLHGRLERAAQRARDVVSVVDLRRPLAQGRAISTSGPLSSGSWSTLRLGECPA